MNKNKCSVAEDLRYKFIIDIMQSNMKEYFKKYDAYIKQYIDEEVQRRVNEQFDKHNFKPYPGVN